MNGLQVQTLHQVHLKTLYPITIYIIIYYISVREDIDYGTIAYQNPIASKICDGSILRSRHVCEVLIRELRTGNGRTRSNIFEVVEIPQ